MFGWFRKLIQRLRKKKATEEEIREYHEKWLAELNKPLMVPKAGHQATRKDLGKFFKGKSHGGFVAKEYRKTILQKKKPEED